MGTLVLERVEDAPTAKHGDLVAVDNQRLARAFRELLPEENRLASGIVRAGTR